MVIRVQKVMTAKGVVIYSTTGLSDGWVSFQWCLNDIMAIEKDNIEIIYNCKWYTYICNT